MRYAILLSLMAAPAWAGTCPPAPDLEPRKSELMAAVRQAPDEAAAQVLIGQLWRLWAQAPDDRAQALLDEGMQRRAALDLAGAKQAFDALIAYCPDYAEGYNQRAFVQFIGGNHARALADLDRALALSPDHIAALAGRALTLIGLGRTAEGQAALRAALALNPWLPERRLLRPAPGEDI